MSAIACPTCSRVIDSEADMCLGCGKKFVGTFRIKIICTSCGGTRNAAGPNENTGLHDCRDCNGTGGFLSTDSDLKRCPECEGEGYPRKDTGWFFKKMERCKCEHCGGQGFYR